MPQACFGPNLVSPEAVLIPELGREDQGPPSSTDPTRPIYFVGLYEYTTRLFDTFSCQVRIKNGVNYLNKKATSFVENPVSKVQLAVIRIDEFE